MLAKQFLMWCIKSHIVKWSNNDITLFSDSTKSHLMLRQTAIRKRFLLLFTSGFVSYKRFPSSVRDRNMARQITKYLGSHPSEFSDWKNYLTGAGRLATLQFRLDRNIITKKCKLGIVWEAQLAHTIVFNFVLIYLYICTLKKMPLQSELVDHI